MCVVLQYFNRLDVGCTRSILNGIESYMKSAVAGEDRSTMGRVQRFDGEACRAGRGHRGGHWGHPCRPAPAFVPACPSQRRLSSVFAL